MSTPMTMKSFPKPFPTFRSPPGAEGWERALPLLPRSSRTLRREDDKKFWFCDSRALAHGRSSPSRPSAAEFAVKCLASTTAATYASRPPTASTSESCTATCSSPRCPVEDGARIEARVPEFDERAGYYFANWDELYELAREGEGDHRGDGRHRLHPLPEMEPIDVITGGPGTARARSCWPTTTDSTSSASKVWQYHFEFLNLGYGGYITFFQFCKQAFPLIAEQSHRPHGGRRRCPRLPPGRRTAQARRALPRTRT